MQRDASASAITTIERPVHFRPGDPGIERSRQQRLPPAAQASPSRLALVCPGPAALACAWPLQTCSAGWCSARVMGAGLVRMCGGCVPCLCVSASASVTWT